MKVRKNEPWRQKPFFVPDKYKRICIQKPGYKPVEWEFSLEKLPPVLLDEVFQYVQSHDLAKLAWLSKSLYWPAVHRIYKTITFFDCDSFEDDGMYDIAVYRKKWKLNYGTASKVIYLKKLYDIVKSNPHLGELVDCLSYVGGEDGCGPMSELLDILPNLRSFNDDGGFLEPGKLTRELNLSSLSLFAFTYPKLSSKLTDLRYMYSDDIGNEVMFHEFARYLLGSNKYEQIRKLDFCTFAMNYSYRRWLSPEPPQDVLPDWRFLLDDFISEGVTLNLTALGLCGYVAGKVESTVSQIRKCINLDNLRSLALNHCESNEPQESFVEGLLMPDEDPFSLLSEITKYTPSLECLSIYPTTMGRACDIGDICLVLQENIPHQLKELSIEYFCVAEGKQEDLLDLKLAITSSQKNLVKLRIENGQCLVPRTEETTIEELETIYGNMHEDWHNSIHRSKLFPRVCDTSHGMPYIREESVQYIKENISVVYKWLSEDPIYKDAADKLPLLAQYYAGGIYFDMKKRGVIVNDETLVF